LLVDLADRQAVGRLVEEGELGPAAQNDGPAAEGAGALDHGLAESRGGAHAAEAEVPRRLPGGEEDSSVAT
jgi:hypothetical protein